MVLNTPLQYVMLVTFHTNMQSTVTYMQALSKAVTVRNLSDKQYNLHLVLEVTLHSLCQ